MHIMYKTIRLLSALVFPPIFWSMYTWPRLKLLEIGITSLMRWTCIGLLEVKPKSAPCRRRFLQGAIYLLVWFAWLWSWLIFFFFFWTLWNVLCSWTRGYIFLIWYACGRPNSGLWPSIWRQIILYDHFLFSYLAQ